MAVIKPSESYRGEELGSSKKDFIYIKEDVKQIKLDKKTGPVGIWLFFLPAFEETGRWYHPFMRRSGMGPGQYGTTYYVPNLESDPAAYFERNFKNLYPEEYKKIKAEKSLENRPGFGRLSRRVVYNVLEAGNINNGVSVLELPTMNGADNLHKWENGKNSRGNPNPRLNDPDSGFVPVQVIKSEGPSPWSFNFDVNAIAGPGEIPEEYLDSDYLYDLTQIFIKTSDQEIIDKLRDVYSEDIFDRCMRGHPLLNKSVSSVRSTAPAPKAVARPMTATAPVVRAAPPAPVEDINPDLEAVEDTEEDTDTMEAAFESNPVPTRVAPKPLRPKATTTVSSVEDAKAFLRRS